MLNISLYLYQRIRRSAPGVFLCLSAFLSLYSQSLHVEAVKQPLNLVMIKMISDYNIQVSFNDQLLSEYVVTVTDDFSNPEQAINYLIRDLPLHLIREGEVFMIVPLDQPVKITQFIYSGQIRDSESGESLPYSHVITGRYGLVSDRNGSFSYTSQHDSSLHFRISYLGYYILDTVLLSGIHHDIPLKPSLIGLSEVVIEGKPVEYVAQIGDRPGVIRLNHKVAYRLPGNGDNSVFNFLRLQPGILAAGEQSSDLIIWGGYAGHSQVLYDGFTVFGLKNFNDNISAVNPYMVKDITVMKGGYPANYGERIGGIVSITGIDGNLNKPSFNFNLNNMTLNGMASVPLFERSALIFAFRRTYYNLYDPEDVNLFQNIGNSSRNLADINVSPDYAFRDMNVKFSGSSPKGDHYYVSLFRGNDNFSYQLDQIRNDISINQEAEEENHQFGGTAYWGKTWAKRIQSQTAISYSKLERDLSTNQQVERISVENILSEKDEQIMNSIDEIHGRTSLEISVSSTHRLEAGIGIVYNQTQLREDSLDTTVANTVRDNLRINGYLQDKISLFSNRTILVPGIRIDYPIHLNSAYVQPRMSISVPFEEFWKMNVSWGIYNQFISETSILDDYGNYRYFWAICNNQDVPVLRSVHYVGGVSYHRDHFIFSLEGYLKNTNGITRYIYLVREDFQTVFSGDSKAYGLDLYLKTSLSKHEAWISYTLGKTLEYFPYFLSGEYRVAPHDQRHEIKSAVLLNFDPFYFTANYVYGSGFYERRSLQNINPEQRLPYSRLDVAFIYRHDFENFHIEGGVSVLNLLNRENLKYSNFIRVPAYQTNSINIYAEAIPFTPTIYMNVLF